MNEIVYGIEYQEGILQEYELLDYLDGGYLRVKSKNGTTGIVLRDSVFFSKANAYSVWMKWSEEYLKMLRDRITDIRSEYDELSGLREKIGSEQKLVCD